MRRSGGMPQGRGRFGALRRLLLLAVGVASAALTVALGAVGAFGPAERSSLDARIAIAGPPAAPDDVVLVAIDAQTFGDLNVTFPFRRSLHAEVIDRLRKAGARVIGYDVQFTEATTPEEDEALFYAVQDAGNVVLATTEVDDRGGTGIFGSDPAVFRQSRARAGNTSIVKDADGVTRRWSYAVDGLRTLPVVLAEAAERRTIDRDDLGGRRFLIDWRRPGSFRTVSFSDVRAGKVPAATFRGRIVMVGATAPSLGDVHTTPAGDGQMPGVELLANALQTVRDRTPLHDTPSGIGTLLAIALAFVGPLLNLRLGPLVAFGLTAAVGAGYAGATQLAFGSGLVLPVVGPLAAVALSMVGALVVHYLTEAFERQRVREVFSRFVSDSVVRKVMDDGGGEVHLASDRAECTVMFTDLRGFTTYAEAHPPEIVVTVLNAYLTEMSGAILDGGGTLTTYLGDGIMALFGAPYPQEDHAERALAVAREMVARMDGFNAWLREQGHGDGFRIGIGLNSGPVMVGPIGSERRLEYTGIGDAVNTAARIEGLTKDLRRQLLVCETTKQRLAARHEDLVYVGEREVRGRSAPVRLWGLEADTP